MRCSECEGTVQVEDNFCRRCGARLSISLLPAIVKRYPLAEYRPAFGNPLWRGAVALVAGTILEFAVRKVAERALKRGPNSRNVWMSRLPISHPLLERPESRELRSARVVRTVVFWRQTIEH